MEVIKISFKYDVSIIIDWGWGNPASDWQSVIMEINFTLQKETQHDLEEILVKTFKIKNKKWARLQINNFQVKIY